MKRIAEFIVKNRLIFFILFVAIVAYCIYGVTRVRVEYEITSYLPDGTDTKKAIKIMDEEFASFGSATVLIKDIDAAAADELANKIRAIEGVMNFGFDSASEDDYKDGKALFSITYTGDSNDKTAVAAYNETLKIIKDSGYRYSVPTPLVNSYADTLAHEVFIILILAAVVIIAVLLLTSKSFAEVLVFPVVFAVAAVMNMGTNYWLGKISFVSNTVCIILQLALAIDYAIILCHRFTEEKDRSPGNPQGALIAALSKAIPEIASSSLTTVSGLVALMFMQLGLGFDLGMVLAKSIICSLVTVFLLMPCLLMWVTKLMDKSRHRSFIPKITGLGVGVIKARYVILSVFVVLFGVCAYLSQTINYCYSQNSIDTSRPSAAMIAQREAESTFGASNMFVILLPKDTDPNVQRDVSAKVEEIGEERITSSLGWATIGLPSTTDENKSYHLTDSMTYADFADMTGINRTTSRLLFTLYASNDVGYITGAELESYAVPLENILDYVFGNPSIVSMAGDGLAAYKDTLEFGKTQLVGKNHYRLVFGLNAPVEGKKTFDLIERLMSEVKAIAPGAIFAGASMSAYDLNGSFKTDNLLITLLTVAFIFIILAVTFRSWGIPIMLVAVIQGAIFINFTIPVMVGNNLFFFVYLIASAIQMGATIDYAILMTNRYIHSDERLSKKEAVIKAMTEAFPTILTSGTIMSVASFLVGFMTSDPLIASMGMTLGFGTVISIVCVLFVLPTLLYLLGPLLKKTVIKRKKRAKDLVTPNPSVPGYKHDN